MMSGEFRRRQSEKCSGKQETLNHILKTRNFDVIICFTLSLPSPHYL